MVYNCRPQNTKNVLQVANIPLLPFPHLPIILKKNPKSKMIEVTYSHADMSNVPCYGHFLKDRVMPMIQFMTSAVNQNRDCDRTLPRHASRKDFQPLLDCTVKIIDCQSIFLIIQFQRQFFNPL